ncbi:MAG: asparaginase [Bdellovibrionota bacterium]|nr:MAG: asparaginase [Bdellovibrionota bacterium]
MDPLVELTRGGIRESVHFGAIAVVDAHGTLLASVGEIQNPTFLRSSAKPFQALPLVRSGVADALHITDKELAVICASHVGLDEHVEVVAGLQSRIGISEQDLLCGCHVPEDRAVAQRLAHAGQSATALRNNCSGKHSGMLAYAKHLWNGDTSRDGRSYLDPQSEVQQHILSAFSELCGVAAQEIVIGIDGCSAPNFAVSLQACAFAAAQLIDPRHLGAATGKAASRISNAMMTFPDMVRGPGRFDTELMRLYNGKVLSKLGAEGYQMIALAPALTRSGVGVGIAVKISDGDLTYRASPVVALETLRQLEVLKNIAGSALEPFAERTLKNHRGIPVGEIRPCFALSRRG